MFSEEEMLILKLQEYCSELIKYGSRAIQNGLHNVDFYHTKTNKELMVDKCKDVIAIIDYIDKIKGNNDKILKMTDIELNQRHKRTKEFINSAIDTGRIKRNKVVALRPKKPTKKD